MAIEFSRIINKQSDVAGVVATVPVTNDHSDGSWLTTDIYVGELFLNTADNILQTRTDSGIVNISSGAGAVNFIELLDVPANYSGSSEYFVKVKEDETGLEFVDGGSLLYPNDLMSSSIISGGAITINADPTKFDVSAGSGYIVDQTISPAVVTKVEWSTMTAISVTNLGTSFATDLAINSSGVVVQQDSFTNEELRGLILIGGLNHSNLTSILSTFAIQVPAQSVASGLREFSRAIGSVNLEGNIYGANGVNLNINKTSGSTFAFGRNNLINKKDPHTLTNASQSALSFGYVYNNGSGQGTFVIPSTDVDPDNYDDGSGTLATVSSNDWTIQRILFFPNSNVSFLQYGTTVYNTKTGALNAVPRANFVSFPGIASASIRGYLIVKQGETDLTSTDTEFLDADKFGSVASLSSGTASASWGLITGTLSDQTDLQSAIDDTTLILKVSDALDRPLALTDRNKSLQNSADVTYTVPPNSSVAFPIGTQIAFAKKFETLQWVEGAGVTINSVANSKEADKINGGTILHKIGTDEWDLIGNLIP